MRSSTGPEALSRYPSGIARRAAGLVSLLLLIFCCHAVAASVPLPLDRELHGLGRYAEILAEGKARLTPEQARTAFARARGRPGGTEVLHFGTGVGPHWIRFALHNPSRAPVERLLVIENPWIDKLQAYLLADDRIVRDWQLGDSLAFPARPLPHRHFLLPLTIPPGDAEVLIRLQTPDPMLVPAFFGSEQQFENYDRFNNYSYGLLYGFVLALALYNLVLYFQIRLRRYLAYVGFLASFLILNMVYTGHFYWWFWPATIPWWQWGHPLVIGLYASAWAAFATTFLQLDRYTPALYRGVLWFIGMFWFCQLALLVLNEQAWAVTTAILFSLLVTVLILPVAAMSWRSGMREAVYLILASIASALGTGITAATVINWLSFDPIGFRAIELGISIDAVLLSFGLAQQFRRTERRLMVAQQVARLDPLTGLYNRRAFEEVVAPLLARAERYRTPVSLILMDLDHFKSINDRFGHHVGDAVLRAVADTTRAIVRKGDVLARWGGEEFILLLPETDREQAMHLAERIRSAVAGTDPDATALGSARVTASLGLFTSTSAEQSLERLVRAADALLYRAKEEGRNRVCA